MTALFPPPADTSTIKLRGQALGAGVQSTTLALMAAHDAVGPMPDCAIDRVIRTGFRNLRGEVFLHRSCLPLDEADLDTLADKGQLDLFADECDGMCGV